MRVKFGHRTRLSATGKVTLGNWSPMNDASALAFIDFTNAHSVTLETGISQVLNLVDLSNNMLQTLASHQPAYVNGEAVFTGDGSGVAQDLYFATQITGVKTLFIISAESPAGSPKWGTLMSAKAGETQYWHRGYISDTNKPVLSTVYPTGWNHVKNGTQWINNTVANFVATLWSTTTSLMTLRVEAGYSASYNHMGLDRAWTARAFNGTARGLYLSSRYYTDTEIDVINKELMRYFNV